MPVNRNSRVFSKHFIDSVGRKLRPDEVPTENLPTLPTKVSQSRVRQPLVKKPLRRDRIESDVPDVVHVGDVTMDVGTNTEIDVSDDRRTLETKLNTLTAEIAMLKSTVTSNRFIRLECIADNDANVAFYTGFPTYSHLKCCFDFPGAESGHLQYRDSKRVLDSKRSLPPLEEFFLVMVRLRLGLFEQDLAYRFGVSQSTVCRIFTTWINFLYVQFQQISLWPPNKYVNSHMPKLFKQQYPITRVIIDATEIFIQQSALPEVKQLTFSNYKNHNTYKCLVGISPSGVVACFSLVVPQTKS